MKQGKILVEPNKLSSAIASLGMTKKEVSCKLGLCDSYISVCAIRRGYISVKVATQLEDLFGITPADYDPETPEKPAENQCL